MKTKNFLFAVIGGILLLFMLGCGDTYEVQSIEITPTHPNIVGVGGTQQFTVIAHYTNATTQDVTHRATYAITLPDAGVGVAPITALSINASGMVEAVDGACTWVVISVDSDGKKTWGTNPYHLTATFSGHTAQGFISVASLAGCDSPDTQPANIKILHGN